MTARVYRLRDGRLAVVCWICNTAEAATEEVLARNWAAVHDELYHAPPITKSRPAVKIPPTARPSHQQCSRPGWDERPRLGYVRRCPHGKLQILAEVGVDSPVQGPGTNYWRDLSRIWDRRTYKAAARALGGK